MTTTTRLNPKKHSRSWTAVTRLDRLAWLLGFSVPLSGGLSPSRWVPGYPDQLTIVRIVTAIALLRVLSEGTTGPRSRPLFVGPRIVAALTFYACLSLVWTPDPWSGINALFEIATAMTTGIAVYLIAADGPSGTAWVIKGLLSSLAFQVTLGLIEIRTGQHLSAAFGATYLEQYRLANVEEAFGSVAWGTLGNPNDLGGYMLLTITLFATCGAYGVRLSRAGKFGLSITALAGIYLGLTSLADARGFRLGLLAILVILITNQLLPSSPTLRAALAFSGMCTLAASYIIVSNSGALQVLLGLTASDSERTDMIRLGLQAAVDSAGIGRGIGAEQHLLDTGAIPTNFHNVFARTAAELGIVTTAVLFGFLLRPILGWLFAGGDVTQAQRSTNVARAAISVALVIYGSVASGVLAAPHFWAFVALISIPQWSHSEIAYAQPMAQSMQHK